MRFLTSSDIMSAAWSASLAISKQSAVRNTLCRHARSSALREYHLMIVTFRELRRCVRPGALSAWRKTSAHTDVTDARLAGFGGGMGGQSQGVRVLQPTVPTDRDRGPLPIHRLSDQSLRWSRRCQRTPARACSGCTGPAPHLHMRGSYPSPACLSG